MGGSLLDPLNPNQDEGRRTKRPPTSFSPINSTTVEINPQNFLNFSFNSFVKMVQNFKAISSASPKLLNLNQDYSSKTLLFSGKSFTKLRL